MQTRIDCDIAGFAVLNSLQKVTERHFWFRVTPGRTGYAHIEQKIRKNLILAHIHISNYRFLLKKCEYEHEYEQESKI